MRRTSVAALRTGAILATWLLVGVTTSAIRGEQAEPGSAEPAQPPGVIMPDEAGPPVAPPPATPVPRPPLGPFEGLLLGRLAGPLPSTRLAATPNMFGNFPGLGGDVLVVDPAYVTLASLPLAADCRRVEVAENNKAYTQDRVFFLYNHFQNTLEAAEFDPALNLIAAHSFSVDRYTLGMEKTLADGLWSVEFRLPLAGETDFFTPDFGVSGGVVGNFALIVKRMLYESATTGVATGLGIDTSTGSRVDGYATITGYGDFNQFTMHNDAVHLLPFLGFTQAPTPRLFYHAFLQVDVPLNGNRIDYFNPVDGAGTFGTLDEQTLLHVDTSMGYWLYRNPSACALTGLASVVEFHYTTTLQDTDVIVQALGGTAFLFEKLANRKDVPNLTVGLHAELGGQTLCRVGGVFPLSDDRAFDAEVQVQLERRF